MTRRHWILVHRWTALALGLHWMLLALTGLLLIFHREIEAAWIGAGSPIESQVQVESALAAAQEALPGTATRIVVQDAPVRALRVFINVGDVPNVVTVDATSAQILSITPFDGSASRTGVVRFIYLLHQQLLLGHSGELLVGASGLFLLVTVIAGLWLAWPKRRQWKRALWPRIAGKPWQKLYALHRSVGLIVGGFVMLSALSGAGMVWSKDMRQWLGHAGLTRASPQPTKSDAPLSVLPDAAVAQAMRTYPYASFVRLDLPASGAAGYVVQLRQPAEFRAVFGTTTVAIDGRDGSILWQRDSRQALWGDAALDALFSIHNGEWLGTPGRVLLVLAGMMLFATSTFGLGMWLLRPSRLSPVNKTAAKLTIST
ncbi:MAG: PepSY domain-containing protein [Qipengyuania sp.]|nr:PepSY domain-containing protein [Qipengyuania sp.]